MARKRNKNRRRCAVQIQSMEVLLDESFRHETHKKMLRELTKKEKEALNKTIFVSNARDLNVASNLQDLRAFFNTNYGEVEACTVATYVTGKRNRRNRYPPAKVTFKHQEDAEQLFGKSLEEARAYGKKSLKTIPCLIAHRGKHHPGELKILPAKAEAIRRRSLYEEGDLLAKTISLSSVSIGHWVPEDGYDFIGNAQPQDGSNREFLEEFNGFPCARFTLDLRRRLLQIRIDDIPSKLQSPVGSADDSLLSILELFKPSIVEEYVTITFRLKQLQGLIDLGREEGGFYSILFSVLDSPMLNKVTVTESEPYFDLHEASERLSHVGKAPFSRCLGFKLNLETSVALNLVSQDDDFSKKLLDFGIFRSTNFKFFENAVIVSTRKINFEAHEKELQSQFQRFTDKKIGLLARSALDKGKFNWYDALHNTTRENGIARHFFEITRAANVDDAQKALETLCSISWPTRFPSQLMEELLFEQTVEGTKRDSTGVPSESVELPRLLVTPTRTIVEGFEVEISNRVVRAFTPTTLDTEDFIRVTFGDENGSSLFSDDFKSKYIYDKIKQMMMEGINLNGNLYKFLAYSSSQLKESSVWMVNCSAKRSIVEEIRSWMGDFSKITTPSKLAARMGQCFSTTIQTAECNNNQRQWLSLSTQLFSTMINHTVRVNDSIPDVLSVDNSVEKCHSDGTGLISKKVFANVLEQVPFSPDPKHVSIIQIRFGGAKGTLTAWDLERLPATIPRHSSSEVFLRPSMIKFSAPYRHLEIIKVGKRVPYYLNRQLIMLLDFHRIPQSILLRMQTSMLDDLDDMLHDSKKAAKMLPSLSGPDRALSTSLLQMIESGLSPSNEPFLFSCLHAVRGHHLINLRKKSRIQVAKGAVLIGGLDETKRLSEGCVFLQVSSYEPTVKTQSFEVITGPVLVAKHPVVHPGDVRMLLAVDLPELSDHKNVLLFSQHGFRPEADKMAGSDLDGDEFAVTWDERLFLGHWNGCERLSRGWYKIKGEKTVVADKAHLDAVNHIPMDFHTPNIPQELDLIGDESLIGHFLKFKQADSLGKISMMWLDHASKEGSAACSQCLKLAELHSVAVDFPKSGIPATIPRDLVIPSSAPRAHWREKKDCDSYKCTSTVGLLYDAVVERSSNQSVQQHRAIASRQWSKQGQLVCFIEKNAARKLETQLKKIYMPQIAEALGLVRNGSIFKDYVLFAKEQRDLYEDKLIALMNKYRIHSEGELLTGCITKYHRLNKRRQHDIAEEVRRQCRHLRQTSRVEFLRKVINSVDQKIVEQANSDQEYPNEDWLVWADVAASLEVEQLTERTAALAAKARDSGSKTCFSAKQMATMSACAKKLAAAYYVVTYHHQVRWWDPTAENDSDETASIDKIDFSDSSFPVSSEQQQKYLLFSFPWVVADIIASGFHNHSKRKAALDNVL